VIDDRLSECLAQASVCADKEGRLEEAAAFALLRRAYGVGYIDAHKEMPDDSLARSVVLDAWEAAAAASRALAGSIANRRRVD
jgi:hypothetical protein